MATGQGYGLDIGGCKGCILWPIGHSSVTLFSLSVSIKDRSLHKASWASHRFIIPSTYLGMGTGKTRCSPVVDPALSKPTVRVLFLVEEVLAPH